MQTTASTKSRQGSGKTVREEDDVHGDINDSAVLRDGMSEARDVIHELRERVELALQEKPYLVPVATGAAGFAAGLLVGSKLARVLVVGAASALLSDTVRMQLQKLTRDILDPDRPGPDGLAYEPSSDREEDAIASSV